MTGEIAVRLTDAGHTYGSGDRAVVAVRRITATVGRGTSTAVVGPSGSGKSTLLHMMAGLEEPTSGTVEWPELGVHPASRRGAVGLIFQEPSLIPALDVRENVALPLILEGLSDDEAGVRALAALDRIGLLELAARVPEELSGGQAQRVAVARVLAMRPTIILADEPTGQLDHRTGARLLDALTLAAQELEAALVLTTHDDRVAERFTTRWSMRDGELLPSASGAVS